MTGVAKDGRRGTVTASCERRSTGEKISPKSDNAVKGTEIATTFFTLFVVIGQNQRLIGSLSITCEICE